MARAVNTDFLHSMRFHVTVADASSAKENLLASASVSPSAGFMSVSTPEATVEAVEYREGLYNFPRKFPGNSTVSDCSMQKGVARGDGTFWSWLKRVISDGSSEYRVDMTINHYDRRVLNKSLPQNAGDATDKDAPVPARQYILHEAFPTRHKVAADLDASSSDISIMELDVAFEWFEVKDDETVKSTVTTTTTPEAGA